MADDHEHPLSKLITIASKAGLGLLPGGSLLTAGFEGVQLLSEEVAKQMERRTQARFEDFIKSVFNGSVSPEVTEYLTVDDYSALLSGCMEDMENEKAYYYGRLAAAIGRGEVSGNARRFMILTLRELSEAQLQMLRLSFIAVQFEIRPSRGSGNLDIKEILNIANAIDDYHYRDLVARSFYIDDKLAKVAGDLVKACFPLNELTPESIGHVAWYPKYLDIIFDTNRTGLITALSEECWNNAIHSSNRSITVLDRAQILPTISPRIMIMGTDAVPNYLPNLKEKMRGGGVLFVSYHDHNQLIHEHFPGSVVIDAKDVASTEVAKQVMLAIKAVISKVSA